MSDNRDHWYIRFPDGKLARAAGVGMLRKQLLAGRVPADAELRRQTEEQWRPVGDHPEFADLGDGHGSWHELSLNGDPKPAPTVASRVDPAQMRQPGVRLLLDELLAALDSTLVFRKMLLACAMALPLWVLFVAAAMPVWLPASLDPWQPVAAAAATVLALLLLQALLTRMTFFELSRMRPARIRDGYAGLPGLWLKSVLVQGSAVGLACAAAWGLRLLPAWLMSLAAETPWASGASWAALCAGALIQSAIWPALLLFGPFAAACVAEEGSLGQAFAQWRRVIAAHCWRALIAQWLILAVACLAALPALLLLAPHLPEGTGEVGSLVARSLLAALAACWATRLSQRGQRLPLPASPLRRQIVGIRDLGFVPLVGDGIRDAERRRQ